MATETLTCNGCNKQWSRELVRGRKPKQCPDCKSGRQSVPLVKASTVELRAVTDFEVEIPDDANEERMNERTFKYDHVIIDGESFKRGDIVVDRRDKRQRYTIKKFVQVKADPVQLYFDLNHASGTLVGMYTAMGIDKLRHA